MKKILSIALVALLLVGCSKSSNEKINPEKLFKEQIAKMVDIENIVGKELMQNMTNELVVDSVEKMMQNSELLNLYANYGIENQGIGTDANCNRVLCCKMPVEFRLEGHEGTINAFVEEIEKIPYRVTVNKFDITECEAGYRVDAVVNFLGNIDSTNVSSNKGVNLQKKTGDIKEEEATVLRDFDINLTLRPSNSDSAAISLGLKQDKDASTCLYSDENKKESITIDFDKENGKLYAEYTLSNGNSKKGMFSTSEDIKFDILSCKRVLEDDYIGVDLTINNSTNKKVSVAIYNDVHNRVNIISKSDSVEVVKK